MVDILHSRRHSISTASHEDIDDSDIECVSVSSASSEEDDNYEIIEIESDFEFSEGFDAQFTYGGRTTPGLTEWYGGLNEPPFSEWSSSQAFQTYFFGFPFRLTP